MQVGSGVMKFEKTSGFGWVHDVVKNKFFTHSPSLLPFFVSDFCSILIPTLFRLEVA